MHHVRTMVLICAATLLFVVSTTHAEGEIRISVPASMTDAVKDISAQFAASGAHAKVVANFGPSGSLAKQINEGAPADLFISANQKWMTFLRDQNRIDPASETVMATNTLVFVGMKNPSVTRMADIVSLKQIAIGSPKSVPAGEYAAQAMEKAGVYKQMEEANKLVMAKDVRQSLTYADRGETDGAFVYKTDALMATQAVVLFEVPQDLYEKITYPIALTVDGAKNPEAKALYQFLTGPEAAKVLSKYGFNSAK